MPPLRRLNTKKKKKKILSLQLSVSCGLIPAVLKILIHFYNAQTLNTCSSTWLANFEIAESASGSGVSVHDDGQSDVCSSLSSIKRT